MISGKMQRNTCFKQGRARKMVDEIVNKENKLEYNVKEVSTESDLEPPATASCHAGDQYRNVPSDDSSLNNFDIIEGTPSPPPISRNIRHLINKTLLSSEESDGEDEVDKNCYIFKVLSDILDNVFESISQLKNDKQLIVSLVDDLYNISDDSVADPDWKNLEDLNTETDSDNETGQLEVIPPKKIKTVRWHKRKIDTYDRNAQKRNRSQCLPYKNYKKQTQLPKAPKSGECKCKLNCFLNFIEEDRMEICKSYWALSEYCRQKDFILMNVMSREPQKRLVNATRKRTVSRYYYFNKNDQKIRVCDFFFKNTLSISNGPINKAFSEVGTSGCFEGLDRRGKHEPANKTKEEDIKIVKEHIESFPTMESHYCRKTSSKKYLESNLSISKMYELYRQKVSNTPVSINVYRNIFCTQYNLDFHKPKKDQCLMCHKYNRAKAEGAPDLDNWQKQFDEHMSLKTQSRTAKEFDKVRANEDESFNSITIDLQKVLHLPTSDVSLLYYLRKLNVYNATIYEARSPNDGFCYLWSEVDGKKGSDEVGTALYLWIQRLPLTITEVSIFSDTCRGQNRNQYLLCLLLYVVQTTHLEVIEHKYLESGHTHMEVDSMHSAIENQMRLMPIFSMIDLCNVIRLARSNRKVNKKNTAKKPYEPIVMSNTDILDLKELKDKLLVNRSIDSEGQKMQWLKVKCFRFEKKRPGIVQYRYDYVSDYKELDVSKKERPMDSNIKNLRKRKHDETESVFDYSSYSIKKAYPRQLPITKAKKKDLIKMCNEKIIPTELHHWYNNLPDKEGPDYLPEEDISDTENL